MKYISTRGGIEPISFKDSVMMGLATDGGLILPEQLPTAGPEIIEKWEGLDYHELAYEVMSLFIDDITSKDLKAMIDNAYKNFDTPEVTPLVKVGDLHILELFHGPTLAFKDIALQFLGNLFSYLLKERNEKMNILGATSGDTGSAAIYGVKGKENINIFILHPHGRVSPIQALQMTTVPDKNVFNIAINGTFDDCQAIVKNIFNDIPFKSQYKLGAVNSINWARILAQVVYYVYSFLWIKNKEGAERVDFSVPTGNFGDIFAGYVARRLISPHIERLILATNENNILTRFIMEGRYKIAQRVIPTVSPSMDIQIASNFERYIYYLFGQDPQRVKRAMEQFEKTGEIVFNPDEMTMAREDFASASISQPETIETIRAVYRNTGYVLDPHTAVGVAAAKRLSSALLRHSIVCLATAHPAKFARTVKEAIGHEPKRPASLEDIEKRPTRLKLLPADIGAVKAYIQQQAT
ncbi:MAG: threonine synthase [Dissulfurimicrobium sp.]|uniref:threonine synthase n=1 Tax=Dissulfurimicrobium hydrothermale TaxID=1750598 RepID=UPI003C73A6E4